LGRTNDQSLLRDRIIGKAEKGRWTAKVAEQVAKRLGVGPLASKPDLADYDPLQETYWSILMTLAWIMWRDADHVRELWDAWRTQCKIWFSGSRLKSRNSASLGSLMFHEGREHVGGNPALMPSAEAEKELWRQLQLGTLAATGMGRRERKRSPIPAESWQDLKLRRSGVWGPGGLLEDEEWKTVTVPGEVVQHLWPAATTSQPDTKGPGKSSPKGKKTLAIHEAVAALWPDVMPKMMVQTRNRQIIEHIEKIQNAKDLVPSEKQIRRYFAKYRNDKDL